MTVGMNRMELIKDPTQEFKVNMVDADKGDWRKELKEKSETKVCNVPRFMTIKQWVSAFGYIPEGGLRHLLFTNESFNKRVAKRIGRKVLLDVTATRGLDH